LDPVWAQLGDRQSRCAGTTGWWKLIQPVALVASAKTLKHNFFLVEMIGANETSLSKMICGSMEMALVHYICSCCFLGAPLSPLRWMSCFFVFFV